MIIFIIFPIGFKEKVMALISAFNRLNQGSYTALIDLDKLSENVEITLSSWGSCQIRTRNYHRDAVNFETFVRKIHDLGVKCLESEFHLDLKSRVSGVHIERSLERAFSILDNKLDNACIITKILYYIRTIFDGDIYGFYGTRFLIEDNPGGYFSAYPNREEFVEHLSPCEKQYQELIDRNQTLEQYFDDRNSEGGRINGIRLASKDWMERCAAIERPQGNK